MFEFFRQAMTCSSAFWYAYIGVAMGCTWSKFTGESCKCTPRQSKSPIFWGNWGDLDGGRGYLGSFSLCFKGEHIINLVIGVSRSPILDRNDLPPGLWRPGLSFESFRQSLKSDLFCDRSAWWLYWIYHRYASKLIYLSIYLTPL